MQNVHDRMYVTKSEIHTYYVALPFRFDMKKQKNSHNKHRKWLSSVQQKKTMEHFRNQTQQVNRYESKLINQKTGSVNFA